MCEIAHPHPHGRRRVMHSHGVSLLETLRKHYIISLSSLLHSSISNRTNYPHQHMHTLTPTHPQDRRTPTHMFEPTQSTHQITPMLQEVIPYAFTVQNSPIRPTQARRAQSQDLHVV
ncbi:hypothetical protein JB92DRAFT_1955816 [Gautieria morchelliformis]|nr:hypothetical protein JB92DRAFT_1955816 [Gautieria morchelliformis]